MRARLQRHEQIGTTRAFACHAQRVDFGMRLAGPQMRALADHFAVANDDAADARVWLRRVNAMLGEHGIRSEEHTSELQSLMRISYAVFCLKKKKKTPKSYITHAH